jgi:hypothetical protein
MSSAVARIEEILKTSYAAARIRRNRKYLVALLGYEESPYC